MRIEEVGIGRMRAAQAVGIDPRRVGTWIDQRGLFKSDPLPRPFTFAEVLALGVTAYLLDEIRLPVEAVIPAANARLAYRALVRGDERLVLFWQGGRLIGGVDDPGCPTFLSVDLAPIAQRAWTAFREHALDLARSRDDEAHVRDAILDFEKRLPILTGA